MSVFNAVTGQRGEAPRSGREIVVVSCLFCSVFDHLIKMVTPCSEKKRSPRASCLVGSNDLTECGSKLETLRKEKNATKYTALKTTGCDRVSQLSIIF